MPNLNNQVQFIGRFGNHLKLVHENKESAIALGSIAVDDSYKNKKGEKVPRSYWFNVKLFNKVAYNAIKYTKKGSKVQVSGKLCNDFYEVDGVTKSTTYLRVEYIQFLDNKKQ